MSENIAVRSCTGNSVSATAKSGLEIFVKLSDITCHAYQSGKLKQTCSAF